MTVTIVRPMTDGAALHVDGGDLQEQALPRPPGAPGGRGPGRALVLGSLVALTALGVWLGATRGATESVGVPGESERTNQATVPGPVPSTPEPHPGAHRLAPGRCPDHARAEADGLAAGGGADHARAEADGPRWADHARPRPSAAAWADHARAEADRVAARGGADHARAPADRAVGCAASP